eukprot:CAMPEP_0171072360 /NCGR_PEP_ID=MMETSP0766_2-20121228/10817_1 /TAXON_ID=439317 /ORGANISM="Gambierdiscus australes, Strain CAWD 149" /LENGTH=68 /DNA_ID=CAMNT_0011528937 /DNA_START=149 /DNA_END=355 /DNA_ORIENTATION=-
MSASRSERRFSSSSCFSWRSVVLSFCLSFFSRLLASSPLERNPLRMKWPNSPQEMSPELSSSSARHIA